VQAGCVWVVWALVPGGGDAHAATLAAAAMPSASEGFAAVLNKARLLCSPSPLSPDSGLKGRRRHTNPPPPPRGRGERGCTPQLEVPLREHTAMQQLRIVMLGFGTGR
jgi:hypothetical protein